VYSITGYTLCWINCHRRCCCLLANGSTGLNGTLFLNCYVSANIAILPRPALSFRTLRFSTNLEHLEADVQRYSKQLKRVNRHWRVSRLVISGDPPTQPQHPQQQQGWCRPKMSISEYNGSDEEVLQVHSAAARTRSMKQIFIGGLLLGLSNNCRTWTLYSTKIPPSSRSVYSKPFINTNLNVDYT
jgi:hypothetical protein